MAKLVSLLHATLSEEAVAKCLKKEKLLVDTNNKRFFELLLQCLNIIFPPSILNVFLTLIMAFSLVILLASICKKGMFEFSFYPDLLLILTLFRLSLNISLTCIILAGRGATIDIITFFGNFAVGINSVVAIVIFAILVLVQFIVITKCGERVAEVAARFTLDAMPLRCMAIDEDLNTGVIDQDEATRRRLDINRKANFCGSMDGASKFIKNDAIMSIIITIILFGGMAMGVFLSSESAADTLQTSVLLAIGAGLVIHIPALIIATATVLIVTRMVSDS